MSLIDRHKVDTLKKTLDNELTSSFRQTDARMETESTSRKMGETLAITVIIIVLSFVTFVHLRTQSLELQYPQAYAWWTSDKGYNNLSFPPPQGSSQITVPTAAVSASFPLLAQLDGLTFQSTPISEQQALFLLHMVGVFGLSRKLAGVHFKGSKEQLRYTDLDTFLPTGNGAYTKDSKSKQFFPNWSYIYLNFLAVAKDGQSANPWANTLWRTQTEFQNAPVIRDYYGSPPKRDIIESLYRGGLCEVAMTTMPPGTQARQHIQDLVGTGLVETPIPCSGAQKTNAAFRGASMGVGISSTALPVVHVVAQKAAERYARTMAVAFEPPSVKLLMGISFAIIGGGAAVGAAIKANSLKCGYTLEPAPDSSTTGSPSSSTGSTTSSSK